jgi:CheY-like chemotaxis protein
VVFLDLNMPDKNGRECLDIIRKTKRLKDIKVVIYSTSSSQADINDTYDKGANLYISKPPTYNKLMLIMKEVLTMHWAGYMPFGNKRNFVFSIKN